MTDMNYLDEKEIIYLDTAQRKIYERFKRKAVLGKYNRLCVLGYVCPVCGLDLNSNNICSGCNSMFSIDGEGSP